MGKNRVVYVSLGVFGEEDWRKIEEALALPSKAEAYSFLADSLKTLSPLKDKILTKILGDWFEELTEEAFQ